MSWFAKIKSGLSKTSTIINTGMKKVFKDKKITKEQLEEFEELLISADLGAALSAELTTEIAKIKVDANDGMQQITDLLCEKINELLAPVAKPLEFEKGAPHVLMLCGVNGNGKTTTAGKIAQQLNNQGKTVMLVACDTFRAAAVAQLQVWAQRTGAEFVADADGADPASVAFKAISEAKAKNIDVVIIDTAGRLHNKVDLMNELSKIKRVIQKHDESAPHDTVLVIDATTGQNALNQVEEFKKIIDISGLIITKLDGTAKGGIALAIAKKFALPIHAIGVGEGVDDLNSFSPQDFAKSLFN